MPLDKSYRWQLSQLPYELEKNLGTDPRVFLDTKAFRIAMLRAERAVCRIEMPELNARATGFLIAPDLLITNDHVRSGSQQKPSFDADPSSVRARFGFVEGSHVSTRTYKLQATDWLVAHSPESKLDFCLVRLTEPAGQHQIADQNDSPLRGWVTPSDSAIIDQQSLFILQHPLGEPLRVAPGFLEKSDTDWIDYHINTDHGSSGSPVFNSLWQCVALHSRAGNRTNRGVRFTAILNALSPELQKELTLAPPEISASEALSFEGIAAAKPSWLPVDLTGFSNAVIQQIASTLLVNAAAAAPDKPLATFEVNLGGGKRLKCLPNVSASTDVLQRAVLKGELDVFVTRLQVLRDRQEKIAIDPGGLVAWSILINRVLNEIEESRKTICGHLEVMIDGFYYSRSD